LIEKISAPLVDRLRRQVLDNGQKFNSGIAIRQPAHHLPDGAGDAS
jgi:hypothetical protein